jgi:hypothetical protein
MTAWQATAPAITRPDSANAGYIRAALRRVPGTAGAWAVLGVTAGLFTAPSPGAIGILAGILAGLIVYPPLGVVLALIGARWKGTLIGGLLGLVAGGLGAFVCGRPDAAHLAAVGLTLGGLVGGTLLTVAFRLPRLILAELRATITAHRRAG